MISSIIAFLIMLNPFALFLYLEPVRKELDHKAFLSVLLKASLISFFICLAFFYLGDLIFQQVFRIDFESFRIFGGIIIFSLAYLFIVKGQKALIIMKGDLDDLASEIALPFMVGAGTISLSILMSENLTYTTGTLALAMIFCINYFTLFILKYIRDDIEKRKFKAAFDKTMGILLRLNGFFIGAIGVSMVIQGIRSLFLI